jgi:hypothetical protein
MTTGIYKLQFLSGKEYVGKVSQHVGWTRYGE